MAKNGLFHPPSAFLHPIEIKTGRFLMDRNIERFQKAEYDLLVIGGGINGAAIAHLAAKRGMKVALLEKGDFASGNGSQEGGEK